MDSKTILLDGARLGYITTDKAVIYSDTGAVHAKSFYLQDVVEDEVRIMSDNQDNDNVHLYVPNLKNYDGLGGRRKSEMMVTSVDQTVTGKKIFEDIEVPNPTENADAVPKSYVDAKINTTVTKGGDTMTGDLISTQNAIQGNTNKAISYDTIREIFLSRRESFPMLTDINNNINQNVRTPTTGNQASNRDYADGELRKKIIFRNFQYVRKDGDVMSGDLNMEYHKITNVQFDNNPTSVARNQELSLKFDKIGGTLTGPIDMSDHSILNLNKTPQFDYEAVPKKFVDDSNSNLSTQITNAYKQYVDHSHVSPSGCISLFNGRC